MNRDDYMSSVTIGARRRVDGPIHLADYDPGWPTLYQREAARVRGHPQTRPLTHCRQQS